jgi:hypothetical protein
VGLLSGPDDVFAARRGRSRRARPASRLLAPLLGLLVGALFALAFLHLFGAALPAWPWLRPTLTLLAALGCAAFLLWLDRRSRLE